MKKYFEDYKTHHRSKKNLLTHYFGIPMIVVAILGLSAAVSPLLSGLILVLANIFYFSLSLPLGIVMVFMTTICLLIGMQLNLGINLFLFVAGWFLQFLGHIKYEKKSPSFYKNLAHLLIGPAFISWLSFKKTIQYFKRN